MGKKKKKRAKSAKKRTRAMGTMLPPSVGAEASTQQPLAALAAQAAAHDPLAPLELDARLPADMTPTRRAAPRTSLVVELHLASDSHFFSGLSGDISEGGVFVSTYRALAAGTPVDLEFSLPGSDRTVKARGEVRWHRHASTDAPPGVGIAFEELAAEDRALIHRFCTLRPPLYYDDVG
jgi:uncharacterized protein (TIGR02266 family)